jgi:hypothetical protein
MNRLQSQFYVSFPVAQAEYTMILMDVRAYSRLHKNVRFIKYLKQRKPLMPAGCETVEILNGKNEFLENDTTPIGPKVEELKHLHLNAQLESRLFLRDPEEIKNNFFLMTEKFFWNWPTTNLGSGRHVLLLDMQIKGCGRTPLAIRHDHSHTWGGHYLWQAIKGYVVSNLFEGAAPLGILKIPYVAAQNSDLEARKQIKSSTNAMAIRESDALRVTQVMTQFDPRERGNYALILKAFLKSMSVKNSSEHMENSIFHYTALLLMGLRHMAVTRENVTIEGRLIDYEDLTLDTDAEFYRCFLMTHKCQKNMPKGYKRFKGEILFTSNLHFYLDAIKLTATGLTQLDPNFKMSDSECKKKLLQMIHKLGKTVFEIDKDLLSFFTLLLTRDALYDKGQNKADLQNTDANEIMKVVKKRAYKISLTQDLGPHECNYYLVDFPRVKFKNQFVENYNCRALMDSEPLIEKMFKMLQLEVFSGKLDFYQMLNFSSECNKQISQHALIFPYQLMKGKVVLKKSGMAKFRKDLITKFKSELGSTFKTFDLVIDPESGDKIIRGAIIHLENGSDHFALIRPELVR